MSEKLTVAVLFGGQSSEHEVSCMSAMNIISSMNREKYEIVLIGITKEGRWLYVESAEQIKTDTWRLGQTSAILSPDAVDRAVLFIKEDRVEKVPVDVIFPVLHGMFGEDGTVQGLFELARIPYVGCGVLASSVSMDKVYTKIIVDALGIRQARYITFNHVDIHGDITACVRKVEASLDYPVFVKPSKAGSSQGISKAACGAALADALMEALKHDLKVLVEETIIGREIECAVLGGYTPEASDVGEILAADTFYSYEAKYFNQGSKTEIHPQLPEGALETVRTDALQIFRAVDGFGLSRVDFFLEQDTNEVIFNEINTIPGFTSISMYPMLWNARGLDREQLIDRLITLAFERYDI